MPKAPSHPGYEGHSAHKQLTCKNPAGMASGTSENLFWHRSQPYCIDLRWSSLQCYQTHQDSCSPSWRGLGSCHKAVWCVPLKITKLRCNTVTKHRNSGMLWLNNKNSVASDKHNGQMNHKCTDWAFRRVPREKHKHCREKERNSHGPRSRHFSQGPALTL